MCCVETFQRAVQKTWNFSPLEGDRSCSFRRISWVFSSQKEVEEFPSFCCHQQEMCEKREKWGGFSHTDFECIHQQQILTRKLFPLIWLEAAAGVVVAGRKGGNCHRAQTQIDCWLLTCECCWEDDDSSLHCENLLNKLRSSRARKVRIFPSCSLEKTFHFFASTWQKRREILNFSLFSRHSWLERTKASHWQLTQMSDGSRQCRRREKKMWKKTQLPFIFSVERDFKVLIEFCLNFNYPSTPLTLGEFIVLWLWKRKEKSLFSADVRVKLRIPLPSLSLIRRVHTWIVREGGQRENRRRQEKDVCAVKIFVLEHGTMPPSPS